MRRPLVTAVIGAAALALSIPLALLGRSMLAAPDRIVAATAAPNAARAHPHLSLFDRAADSILGARTAYPLFTLAREYRHVAATPIVTMNAAAPVQLARLARQVGPTTERSQAHLMVGAVFALPAGNGSMTFSRLQELGGGRLLAQAVGEVHEAALLDENNEAATYDLELMLKSQAASAARQKHERETTKTNRPNSRRKNQGQGQKHPPTRRKLREGGAGGTGSGY